MKFRLINISILSFTMSLMLIGCAKNFDNDQQSLTQQQQRCNSLKNQLVFGNDASGSYNFMHKDIAQDAQTSKLYSKYNCQSFENKN